MFASPIKKQGEGSRQLVVQPLTRNEYDNLHGHPIPEPDRKARRADAPTNFTPVSPDIVGLNTKPTHQPQPQGPPKPSYQP